MKNEIFKYVKRLREVIGYNSFCFSFTLYVIFNINSTLNYMSYKKFLDENYDENDTDIFMDFADSKEYFEFCMSWVDSLHMFYYCVVGKDLGLIDDETFRKVRDKVDVFTFGLSEIAFEPYIKRVYEYLNITNSNPILIRICNR